MPPPVGGGKLYPLFTLPVAGGGREWRATMSFIALGAFAVILGFGRAYGAWSDAGGQLQITVIICFLLGAVCGYKARG